MAKQTNTIPVSDDPAYVVAAQPAIDLREKMIAIKSIVARLSQDITTDEFKTAVDFVIAGNDPVLAAQQLDNSKALASAQASLRILTVAIDRAQKAAEAERVLAQKRYVQRVMPRHHEITARIASALAELGAAQLEALGFEQQTRADGLDGWPADHGPLGIFDLGDPHDQYSTFAKWFTAAARGGAIDAAIVPESWTTEWPRLRVLQNGAEIRDGELLAVARLRHGVGIPSSRAGLWRKRA